MPGIFRRDLKTHRKTPGDDRSRDWSDASTSQGTTRIVSRTQENHAENAPPEPQKGTNTADTLALASRNVREHISVVLSLWFVVSCVAVLGNEYSMLLRKPT